MVEAYLFMFVCRFFILVSAFFFLTQNNSFASNGLYLNQSDRSSSSVEALRKKRKTNWGIAAVMRQANIPYREGNGEKISSFNPMIFFSNDYIYWNGLEGGLHLKKTEDWQFNALLRMRFLDLPPDRQNEIGGDTGDFGFQLKQKLANGWYSELDGLSDDNYRFQGVLSLGKSIYAKDYVLNFQAQAIYKDSRFNSFYYGLSDYREQGVHVNAGVDFKAGFKARYRLFSDFYAIGAAYATYFDKNVRQAQTISEDWQGEVFFGIGIFNNEQQTPSKDIANKPYLKVAHGWATPSNLGAILTGKDTSDPYKNQLTSISYGFPVADSLLGLPLDIYASPGLAWHWSSDVQESNHEWIASIKAYYTMSWPITWRLGVGEGLSYVNKINYVEKTELDKKGYKPSQLLNYVDLSIDINIGESFNLSSWKNIWLGYSVHHRSAIFENSSQFGRIKGGSNYNTFYVQIDL